MAFCENCGKEVKDDAKFCGGCGAAMGVTAVPRCPKCGKELKADAVFCEGCGTAVRAAPNAPVVTAAASAPTVRTAPAAATPDTPRDIETLSLPGYFMKCLRYFAVTDGRARRKEYWGFYLGQFIFNIGLNVVLGVLGIDQTVLVAIGFVLIAAGLAVNVRRLHDVGKSGWWLLLCFTIIGLIPVIIWILSDSAPSNKYGPNPKQDRDTAPKKQNIPLIAVFALLIALPFLLIPQFEGATHKTNMAEVPRVFASFEASYLAAQAEYGPNHNYTKDDLVFQIPSSAFFEYEYVKTPYGLGGIVGLEATALSNIGKFSIGNSLQTMYRASDDSFTHCARSNDALAAAKKLVPNFFRDGDGVCGDPQPTNTGSAQSAAPTQSAVSSFTDSRDGKKYKVIKIGSQTWMAENLNYTSDDWEESYYGCYNEESDNCNKYGRLYEWKTAKKACPAGWHLPSDKDWTTLIDYAGGSKTAGKKLKSKTGWNENGNGTDDYGFSALPGGKLNYWMSMNYNMNYDYSNIGSTGSWWSDTKANNDEGWYRVISHNSESVSRNTGETVDFPQSMYYSVRCVQN